MLRAMDLSHLRILVTNDDGINAEGIKVLEAIARELSDDVWVVAPEQEMSAASHSLTVHVPLRIRKVEEKRYAILGTPTDSVLLAATEICRDKRIDLVLSGVNSGSNLAEDITYSGTVAAAMEATLLDIPAIAFSNYYHKEGVFDWEAPRKMAAALVRKLMQAGWPKGSLINVNFPGLPVAQVKGVKLCPQGRRKIGEKISKHQDPKGRDYYWVGLAGAEPYSEQPEADYQQCKQGYVTVTPLHLDLTNYAFMEEIRDVFAEAEKAA